MNPPLFTIHPDPSLIVNGRIGTDARHIHGTGEQLANAGGQLALDYATRLSGKDLRTAAISFLRGFASTRGVFHCSDVREAAKGTWLDVEGADPRYWGSIIKAAAKEGFITPLGYRKTERRESHGRPERVWQYVNP